MLRPVKNCQILQPYTSLRRYLAAYKRASLAVAVWLCLAPLPVQAVALASSLPTELKPLIEYSLDYGHRSIEDRGFAIQRAYSMLEERDEPLTGERAGVDLAFSYLHYELGNLKLAMTTLKESLGNLSLSTEPDLYVRSTGLLAGLLTTTGQREEGLRMLEELLAADLPAAQATRVEFARVNYASTLAELGRTKEASLAYEQGLVYAQASGDDVLALAAGTNFVALLKNQGLSAEAKYWLYQLKPAMARLPHALGTAELELFEICLALEAGKTAKVLQDIEAFMARPKKQPEVIEGQSQIIYADALRAAGRQDESLAAARRAVLLTKDFPLEQPDARIAIIRTLLAIGNLGEAGEELQLLLATEPTEPSAAAIASQLKLEYALRIGDNAAAKEAFDVYMLASRALSEYTNSRQADYYGEKLVTQRTRLELEIAREAQALSVAEVATQKAQANELLVREKANRQRRNWQLGGITALSLGVIGLMQLQSRRRLQQRLQDELSDRNASLSALVESKSKDLVDTVTEQAELKQALVERRHLETIGQIAGHVAHDFNNTLQVVSSANQLLEPLAVLDNHKKILSASNRSIQAGSSTVRQLLSYSRNQQLEQSVFKLGAFLNDNAALFRSAIGEVNSLRIDLCASEATVQLDKGQLTSSLINLLRNSVDAMRAPGEIILSCNIAVPPESAEEMVRLQVIDQGRGMSEEECERAFEPFYTTKSAESGTGLGLSSVYGFVVQSGGVIGINSQPGAGTCIALHFPMHHGRAEEKLPGKEVESLIRGAQILVVEDNELVAATLEDMLQNGGAETKWVDSAEDAQSCLKESADFDILLSDINIRGGLNGFELARWVRDAYPKIQIGMMSGYGPAMEQSSDVPILPKPFNLQQLLEYLADRAAKI